MMVTEEEIRTTWRSEGVAGPSREVSQRDGMMPGAGSAGHNDPGSGTPKKATRKPSGPKEVERATALHDLGIGCRARPKNNRRRETERDLLRRDPEIPYMKTETALRNLVCSLMERQDRMNEEIFYRINDIGFKIDELEDVLTSLKCRNKVL